MCTITLHKFETTNDLPSYRKVLIDNGVKDYNELLKKVSLPSEIQKEPVVPRKLNPKKIYTFQNDTEIDRLSQQLVTIRDFNLSSKEQIYSKAEELKHNIDEKKAKLKELSAELPTLKSDIAQLKYYFSVIGEQRELDANEEVRVLEAREIVAKYGVKSEMEIANLERRLKLIPEYASSIKNEIFDEQLKLKRMSDLITVYENLVEGNYIDNLIKAQRERQIQEAQQENPAERESRERK